MKEKKLSFFENKYKNEFIKTLNVKNPHLVPKLNKIVISMGLGEDGSDKKLFQAAMNELSLISGRKPAFTKAKKSISSFKLREGQIVGIFVTLRGKIMYEFLERLVFLALPRIHDFKGFSAKSFDSNCNFSIGIKDHLVFSELSYDKIAKQRGLNISFDIYANTKNEALELLTNCFHLPIK